MAALDDGSRMVWLGKKALTRTKNVKKRSKVAESPIAHKAEKLNI
jgi:hypothetical protein